MKKKISFLSIILLAAILISFYLYQVNQVSPSSFPDNQQSSIVDTIIIPSDRFPETASHIKAAIDNGESSICTINRKGADDNRKKSLKGTPTKPNLDRDEFPMAMCVEGGTGADIAYISPTDNRGAGSWVSSA
jgi:hypothetical protein